MTSVPPTNQGQSQHLPKCTEFFTHPEDLQPSLAIPSKERNITNKEPRHQSASDVVASVFASHGDQKGEMTMEEAREEVEKGKQEVIDALEKECPEIIV